MSTMLFQIRVEERDEEVVLASYNRGEVSRPKADWKANSDLCSLVLEKGSGLTVKLGLCDIFYLLMIACAAYVVLRPES